MSTARTGAHASGWRRKVVAALGVAALGTISGLVAAGPAAAAETDRAVDDATFVWGLSGYAQKGIFGPWTFKDVAGNAEQLVGSVSGGTQTQYVVAPVPATSMPASSGTQKTANAIRFTAGAGTVDDATGARHLTWTGTYTVNAYPVQYGAPNEIYSDPELTVLANGSGTLTFDVVIGAGVDMSGNPTPAANLGRLPLATFDAGDQSGVSGTGLRITPDYQGVALTTTADQTAQVTCTASSGSTGWWGSWPAAFVQALPAAIQPHFYSTGCGGLQDNKPALPFDVTYTAAPVVVAPTPVVTVSQTALRVDGTSDIVVTGSGFPQTSSTGTPGVYVAVGPQVGTSWWLSASAFQLAKYVRPSFTGAETASGAKLETDGSFTVHFDDVKAVYTSGTTTYDASVAPFAVLTFATQGSSDRALDTVTPLSFTDSNGVPVVVEVPTAPVEPGALTWSIDGGAGAINLGTAVATPTGFLATGALRTIAVTDTRAGSPAWSLTGQVGDFTTSDGTLSFGGQALGWTPAVSANTVDAVAGTVVTPGTAQDDGLRSSATLAWSAAGHAPGSVTADAALRLLAPAGTPAGSYTATLTLTALS